MRHSRVDERVRRRTRRAAIWAGRGLFKGTALIAAFALIVAVWLWDAALLTETADYNLWMIKTVTGMLPDDWPSRVESALRMFGADRALLLTEAVLLAKMVMVAAGYPFVLAGRGIALACAGAGPPPNINRQSSCEAVAGPEFYIPPQLPARCRKPINRIKLIMNSCRYRATI